MLVFVFFHFWPPICISLLPCKGCNFIMTTLITFCHKIRQNMKTLLLYEGCWCFVPFIDKWTKSACQLLKQWTRILHPGYTQIYQVFWIIVHVFVPFENGWFIFGWLISRKFWGWCPHKHWWTHLHLNYPNMRCIQRMIYSQGKCWSWFTTTIFWGCAWQFCFFLTLDFFLKLDGALKFQLRIMCKCRTTMMIQFSLS